MATGIRARVLVVEDDEKLAALLCRVLADDGLDTRAVFDGEAALAHGLRETFDLIVLDVGLPCIDGIEVCRRLRSAGRDVPVMMLSARDAVDDCLAGKRAGAVDYLVKPFSIAELSARARDLVGTTGTGPAHRALMDGGESRFPQSEHPTEGESR